MDVDFSKKEMACGQSCKKERQKDVIAMLINQDRGYKGIGMEGRIATWYAKNTQKEIVEFGCLRIVFPRKFPRTAVFLKSLLAPAIYQSNLQSAVSMALPGWRLARRLLR